MKKSIISLLITIISIVAFATVNGDGNVIKLIEKSDIINNVTYSVYNEDDLFQGEFEYLVKLVYTRDELSDVEISETDEEWGYKVIYQIEIDGNPVAGNHELEITWNAEEPSTLIDLNVHQDFPNGNNAAISIINIIDYKGDPSVVIPEDIDLELIQRKLYKGCFGVEMNMICIPPDQLYNCIYEYVENSTIANVSQLITNNTMNVHWSFVPGASEYELEWVFIDAQDKKYASVNGTNVFDSKDLTSTTIGRHYKEPVNVTVTNQFFDIYLSYPEGKLFYRVRAIANRENGSVCEGDWSPVQGAINITGFENDKIWQEVVNYAEDGKNRKVITYYDGSQRFRQSITDLSTDNLVVATESMYDYEGTPSLQIIPTPVNSSELTFIEEMNMLNPTTQYSKDNFDKGLGAPPLDNHFGASKYYSPENSITDQINYELIPNADGYVFTQTQYLRDGTGRTRAISGIGPDMQLSSGKETNYYYGTTNDAELRRLFGSNVGIASHYRKNLVKDPNGQLSVTYVDQEGRTIATSLTGDSPDNVVPLELNVPTIYANLNANNDKNPEAKTSISTSKVFNVLELGATLFTFQYDFTGALNQLGAPFNICQTCEYELEIQITNMDGMAMPIYVSDPGVGSTCISATGVDDLTNTTAIHPLYDVSKKAIVKTFKQDPADCSATFFDEPSIDFFMRFCEIGNYNISKKLVILDRAIDEAMEVALATTTLPQLADYQLQYENNIDYSLCDYTCDQLCKREWLENYKETNTVNESVAQAVWDAFTDVQKTSLLSNCIEQECGQYLNEAIQSVQENDCESILDQIKTQVEPDGFYYNSNAYWIQFRTTFSDYITNPSNYGNLASSATVEKDLEEQLGDFGVPVNYNFAIETGELTSLINLLRNPNSYSDDFVFLQQYAHPEYCHYTWCLNTVESDVFDTHMMLSETLNDAQNTTDNINNWNFFNAVSQDPYFIDVNSPGYGQQTSIIASMADYKGSGQSMWAYFDYNNTVTQFEDEFGTIITLPTASYIDVSETHYIDLVDPSDGLDAQELEIIAKQRWEHYRGAYQGLKLKLQIEWLETEGCGYIAGEEGIISDPRITEDPDDAMAFGMSNVAEMYDDVCAGNLMSWRIMILEHCPDLDVVMYENSGIAALLANYCEENIGLDNPMGYILDGELTTNTDLIAISAILAGLPGACDLTNANFVHTNPYTFATNDDGTLIMTDVDDIPACYSTLFNFLNAEIFPNNINVTASTTYPIEYAWSSFSTNTFDDLIGSCLSQCTPPNPCTGGEGNAGNTEVAENFVELLSSNEIAFTIHSKCVDKDGILVSTQEYTLTSISFIPITGGSSIDPTDINSITNFYYEEDLTNYGVAPIIPNTHIRVSLLLMNNTTIDAYVVNYPLDQNCGYGQASTQSTAIATGPTTIVSYDIDYDDVQQNCYDLLLTQANYYAEQDYQDFVNGLATDFYNGYVDNCLNFIESFEVSYELKEYHYTLYYYDQAGNLTQTVPPEGVKPLNQSHFGDLTVTLKNGTSETLNNVWQGYVSGQENLHEPDHNLKSQYRYNTLGQMVWKQTPDDGVNYFFYDKKGFLNLGVHAQQYIDDEVNYTLYDDMGRIKETGLALWNNVYNPSSYATSDDWYEAVLFEVQTNNDYFTTLIAPNTKNQQIFTYRGDIDYQLVDFSWQKNVKNNIILSEKFDKLGNRSASYRFSYDEHSNITKMEMDIVGLGIKTIDYEYDLQSSNVNIAYYQKDASDQFIHKYEYDADKRLTNVYTSTDNYLWDEDVEYFYYAHGPLSRVETGEDKLQAMDYQFTITGWLKAINGSKHSGMSVDNLDVYGGVDEYMSTMGYYDGDYEPIVTSANIYEDWTAISNDLQPANGSGPLGLFNGNIAYLAQDIGIKFKTANPASLNADPEHPFDTNNGGGSYRMGIYKYDQLNRIKNSASRFLDNSNLLVTASNDIFRTSYDFDRNGNITGLTRYDNLGGLMDDLKYWYDLDDPNDLFTTSSVLSGNRLHGNRLHHVTDLTDGGFDDYINTIEPNSPSANLLASDNLNFSYDAEGNLIADVSEEIESIEWNLTGKIDAIIRTTGSTKPNLFYGYDSFGNRIWKRTEHNDGSNDIETAYYVLDLSGNRLASYKTESYENDAQYITDMVTNATCDCIYSGHFNANATSTYQILDGEVIGSNALLEEFNIYGNSRLGTYNPNAGVTSALEIINVSIYKYDFVGGNHVGLAPNSAEYIQVLAEINAGSIAIEESERIFSRKIGNKAYEISNHLGNVMLVMSDKREGYDKVDAQGNPVYDGAGNLVYEDGIADAYFANVTSLQDYYPYGFQMPGRKWVGNAYRYGFNGHEKDEDIAGEGNTLDFGARIYSPRIGKFFSTDPWEDKYAWQTPYAYYKNSPIAYIDYKGYGGWGDFLDVVQTGLDVAGLIPAVGIIPDLVNAGISTARGDYIGAGLSLAAAIPVIGQAAGAAKITKTVVKVTSNVVEATTKKVVKETIEKTSKEVVEKTSKEATEKAWKGPVDYSDIVDHKSVDAGKNFTQSQKKKMIQKNMDENGGVIRSDADGAILNPAKQSKKGVAADMNQAELDHIFPKAKGGSNSSSNAQILSKTQNIAKSDKVIP